MHANHIIMVLRVGGDREAYSIKRKRETDIAVVRKGWPLPAVLRVREKEPWCERGGPSNSIQLEMKRERERNKEREREREGKEDR